MECPRCHDVELKVTNHLGIEVDQCPKCKGMWLDHHEMDELEDRVFNEDHRKGTMEYSKRGSDISCPKCQGLMTTFNYRAYDLPIDFCDAEHGFWLDEGEEKRVLEVMQSRKKDLVRSETAEGQWVGFLKGLKGQKSPSSGGIIGKVKGLFKGKG
jgi:Zn-finger nucleic acid-binding protein